MKFKDLYDFNSIYQDSLFPDDLSRAAFIYQGNTVTYAECKQRVDLLCVQLAAWGIKPGDRLGYSLPSSPEAFFLYMALQRLGACAIPLHEQIPPPAKLGIWQACKADFVIAGDHLLPAIKQALLNGGINTPVASLSSLPSADIEDSAVTFTAQPDAIALMAMSSGTTGRPKIVAPTQRNAATVLKAAHHLMQPSAEGYQLVIGFPLSTSGILTCMGMFAAGVTLVIPEDMSPNSFLTLAESAQAIAAPPAYLEGLTAAANGRTYASVERVYTGMDFFRNALLEKMRAPFPNLNRAGNGYGLVETSTVLMTWHAHSADEFSLPTNRMQPVAGIGNEFAVKDSEGKEVAPGQQGELHVRGNSVVSGYLNQPDSQAFNDGWFATGDIAIAHEDGSISLLGRSKDIIKRGGRSISPIEVTDFVNQLANVEASAAVGVPHELYGEMLWLFIVGDAKHRDIMRACRQHLAPYLVPDQIRSIAELPKNPGVGKLDYNALKILALAELTEGADNECEMG
ncbi:class I adenylate-forming enzyme family protein [Salinibius halmophilus]|uniref:class I adenylate-forming enzyme family protein n=1 Tax=Salinibius halmophilus TaxID=1853216 RepID=UPI000E6719D3|nr:class I adenylate-forming enzyme family protein [Salinibius halmophilus]